MQKVLLEADTEDVDIPDIPEDLAAILKRTRAFATDHPNYPLGEDVGEETQAVLMPRPPSPTHEPRCAISADPNPAMPTSNKKGNLKAIPFVLVSLITSQIRCTSSQLQVPSLPPKARSTPAHTHYARVAIRLDSGKIQVRKNSLQKCCHLQHPSSSTRTVHPIKWRELHTQSAHAPGVRCKIRFAQGQR